LVEDPVHWYDQLRGLAEVRKCGIPVVAGEGEISAFGCRDLIGAGPFATLNLADMGAEVIKIEDASTGGDVSRSVPPYRLEGDSLYFQSWNRNKRSVTLDLRKPEGMQVFHDLVAVSDVVFNNLRGDQPVRLGLTYACLSRWNPRILCCSLNGFGSEGPRAKDPGYDYLVQACAGYMGITGEPCGPPAACGVSFIDHAAGFAAALGIVSALYAAQKTGIGRDLEVSLLDTAYSMLSYLAVWNLNQGFQPQRYPGSAHQTLVPVQTFETSDCYITIFCGKEKFWRLLCEAFEDPGLTNDPRFSTFDARLRNRAAAVAAIQDHFLKKTTGEWLRLLTGKVPCAAVQSLEEALSYPELVDRGTIVEVPHPAFGTVRQVNTPVRWLNEEKREHRCAPALGQDNEAVFKDYLKYSRSRIEELRRAAVI
jgi:crotonobetainyl-CoA:carnitine CoA-transferase CaiB-like acyl-CoA transferase